MNNNIYLSVLFKYRYHNIIIILFYYITFIKLRINNTLLVIVNTVVT